MILFLNFTISSTAMAAGILLLKSLFRNKLSQRLSLWLWSLLLLRMLMIFLSLSFATGYQVLPAVHSMRTEMHRTINVESAGNSENLAREVPPEYVAGEISLNRFNTTFTLHKHIQDVILPIWGLGGALLLLYFILIYLLFSQKVRSHLEDTDTLIQRLLAEYKEKLGIKQAVVIKRYGNTPLVKGLFKPMILLPENSAPEEVPLMLLHELLHIKHGDIILNVLSTLVLCINWYNPVIWLCHGAFKRDIEVLCDKNVIDFSCSKKAYAALLLKTASNIKSAMPMTACLNTGKRELMQRIGHMAHYKRPNRIWTAGIVISIGLLIVSCFSVGSGSSKFNEQWAPPFEGLRWGMSEAEVLEVLGLSEEDIERNGTDFTTANVKLFGTIDDIWGVRFIFDLKKRDALSGIVVVLNKEAAEPALEALTEKLGPGEFYKEEDADPETVEHRRRNSLPFYSTHMVTWNSGPLESQPENFHIFNKIINSGRMGVEELYAKAPEWEREIRIKEGLNRLEAYLEWAAQQPMVMIQLNMGAGIYKGFLDYADDIGEIDNGLRHLWIDGSRAAMINEPDKYKYIPSDEK